MEHWSYEEWLQECVSVIPHISDCSPRSAALIQIKIFFLFGLAVVGNIQQSIKKSYLRII